jgi:hypothetical protein
MKLTKQFFLFLGFVVALTACKKDLVTKPVKFTETVYTNHGSWDNTGLPTGLLTDTISDGLLNFIRTTLPEGVDLTKSHPEFFSSSAIADIAVLETSDVYVTFVEQSGVYNNAMAFYTYLTHAPPASAKDIKNIVYFLPNASGANTPLKAGNKIKLGTFDAGTSIGFVLMQKAWDSTKATLDNGAVHFCSNDVLNPEVDPAKKKHAVIVKYPPEDKVLVGFEDLDRTESWCDNDFSDVVFYCTLVKS